MTYSKSVDPPEGYMWVEDLAAKARQDLNTIIWLCEQEIIQGVPIQGHWAVRIVRTTTTQAGTAIVRDLKAGGDISIGSVIGQYVTFHDTQQRAVDKKQFITQEPIRLEIENAKQWIRYSWIALAGGFALLFAFIVITWPIASFLIVPGYTKSKIALEKAKHQGDNALIEEAHSVYNQALITSIILWSGFAIGVLIGLSVTFSNP